MDDDANVFKLVGPALIKQDLVEARSNVDKRLEYIKGEMDRLDGQIKSTQGKMQDKEKEVGRESWPDCWPDQGVGSRSLAEI